MKDRVLNGVCMGISALGTITQTNEVMQIVSLVITILSGMVILCYNLYRWYREASKDGIITKEEIKDAKEIIENHIRERNDK